MRFGTVYLKDGSHISGNLASVNLSDRAFHINRFGRLVIIPFESALYYEDSPKIELKISSTTNSSTNIPAETC